jgi:hypothetical protein
VIRLRAIAALALLLVARPAAAQVIDTTRADSLARDTTDWTAEFLRGQQEARQTVPVIRRLGGGSLLPPLSRIVLPRDTIEGQNAETVADLLTKVPGVYVWRGGWAGRPELPTYQGRGAASVEYLVDGVPFLPLGNDSLHIDPSQLPLSFFDRMEIEKLPGLVRVSLFSKRHDRRAPRTRIGVSSGDLDIARYQGSLEKRGSRGQSFGLAFDHLSVPMAGGRPGDYRNTQGWIHLGYVRSPRFAAELSYFQSSPDREPVLATETDTLSRGRKGTRRDLQARVALGGSADRTGITLDLIGALTGWSDQLIQDTVRTIVPGTDSAGNPVADTTLTFDKHRRTLYQAGAIAGWRGPISVLTGSLWLRNEWTPLELRGHAGLVPNRFATLSAEAAYQRHDGNRNSAWVTARAGMSLPLGLVASGVWRRGTVVSFPMIGGRDSIPADAAQDVDDRSVAVRWRPVGFAEAEGTWTSTAGYAPRSFDQYPSIVSIAPSARTEWLTFSGRLSPRQWVILDGWYSTPRGSRPEGQPRTHSVVNATIESRFLRTFPSGIFGLKLRVSMETWGTGTLGRDSLDAPVTLRGATFLRGHIAIRLGSFMAYYDRYNLQDTRLFYVPGLEIPGFASTFGVRWEFSN